MENVKTVIITGLTGSGKTTLKNMLKSFFKLEEIVQFTTRPMREGEYNGLDYNFIPEETFRTMKFATKFEVDTVHGRWKYGFTFRQFQERRRDSILVTDMSSALRIKQRLGEENCLILFLNPPLPIVEERLVSRGDDPYEVKRRLFEDYKRQFQYAHLAPVEEITGVTDMKRNAFFKVSFFLGVNPL